MRLTSLCAALLCSAATAAPAGAATIEISGDALTFRAAPGEENVAIFATGENGKLAIRDSAPVTAPAACTPPSDELSPVDFECPMPARLRLVLGDGGDMNAFDTLPQFLSLEVFGGPGNDVLHVGNHEYASLAPQHTLDGGDGDDTLNGSQGVDVIRGGGGKDKIRALGGADDIDAGDGDDDVSGDRGPGSETPSPIGGDRIDGGPGVDFFTDYASRTSVTVAVTLDGQGNDGPAGEGDNVTSFEHFENLAPGEWTLSDASDRVSGFDHKGLVTVRAMGGDDHLRGHNSRENFDGGAGADHVEGGNGDDTLTGGPGADRIIGDDASDQCTYFEGCTLPFGNDTIFARDGEADSIDCGVGADRAVVDAIDTVAPNCETVEKPSEQQQGQQGQQGGGTTGTGACRVPKVVRLKQAAAVKKLRAAGCQARVKRVRHRKVQKGRVVRASRKAGATFAYGTAVTLYVSRGK